MIVFVVSVGSLNEGYEVKGIFLKKDIAIKRAKALYSLPKRKWSEEKNLEGFYNTVFFARNESEYVCVDHWSVE